VRNKLVSMLVAASALTFSMAASAAGLRCTPDTPTGKVLTDGEKLGTIATQVFGISSDAYYIAGDLVYSSGVRTGSVNLLDDAKILTQIGDYLDKAATTADGINSALNAISTFCTTINALPTMRDVDIFFNAINFLYGKTPWAPYVNAEITMGEQIIAIGEAAASTRDISFITNGVSNNFIITMGLQTLQPYWLYNYTYQQEPVVLESSGGMLRHIQKISIVSGNNTYDLSEDQLPALQYMNMQYDLSSASGYKYVNAYDYNRLMIYQLSNGVQKVPSRLSVTLENDFYLRILWRTGQVTYTPLTSHFVDQRRVTDTYGVENVDEFHFNFKHDYSKDIYSAIEK